MSKHSQVMGLGISLALVNACSGTSIPIKYNDIRLSNPFGDSYYAVALDRGQIKVVASDFAGVSLGLCADKFGAVEHRNCTANGEGFTFDRPKVNELSKGNFGQYTQLKSLTSTSGAGIGPVDAKLATVDAQYEVVYEWSRFKTVDVPAHHSCSTGRRRALCCRPQESPRIRAQEDAQGHRDQAERGRQEGSS